MSYLIKLISFFLLSFTFFGCSDKAEFTSSTSLYTPTVTGQFLDDVVQGLKYNCSSGTSGTTNIDGEYTCNVGDDATFLIGLANIGTIAAQSRFITPYSFFPDNIDAVINLARLLQSLDNDGDTNNGVITLNTDLLALIPSDLDFASADFVVYVEAALGITLISAEDALTNLNTSILAAGGAVPSGGNISVADAGEDQNTTYNVTITLDGSGSWDADADDNLTYIWSFEYKPADSNATLSSANSMHPTFVADLNGTYIIGLLVNDGTISSALDTVTIRVANALPVPTFSAFTTDEDVIYSSQLSASDENNDTLIYIKVADPANGSLILDANGSFVYTPSLNYNGDDSFSYKVNDSKDDSVTQTVRISVLSVSDTPLITSLTPVSVNENQTSAMTITAIDGDGDSIVYSVSGTDAGSFDINATTGVLTFKVAPDYESKNLYNIVAQASDVNTTGTKDIIINIVNVAEVARITDSIGDVDENSAAGTSVGSIGFAYTGDSAVTAVTLSGEGSENFVVSTSGAITVNTGASLDYELQTLYTLTAVATSASGDSNIANVTITINNIAEIVPTLIDTTLSIKEDALTSDVVGTLTIADSGDAAITSITISGVGSENFEIDLNGNVTVSASASFDYETTTSYTLSAVATNSAGASTSVTLLIYINNIVDTVATLSSFSGTVDENSLHGVVVGSIGIVDGDSPITAITLSGTGNENFVVATDGEIRVANGADLDYEALTSYTLSAVATNGAGDSSAVVITIHINNLAEIATLADSTGSVIENEVAGATVGNVTIVDGGDSAITAITLAGTGNENFVVDTAGVITLEVNATLDYETTTVYNLTAIASNTAGDSASVNVTINVTDYPFNPTFIAKIEANDAEFEDYYGSSVAVSGNYIVVGAPQEDPGTIESAGSAYVYKKEDNGSVNQIAKIIASGGVSYDYFGNSVAMSGEYIVVGAYKSDGPGTDQGNVFVFKKDSDVSITQIAKLTASDPENEDFFGTSVAIDGDYIVVGASYEDSGALDAGSAYVFKRNSDISITQIAKLQASTPTTQSFFGASVSISGDYIAIGAPKEDDGATTDAGAVYIFKRNSDLSVTQIAKLQAATTSAGSFFGNAVSVSGDLIAVGANQETTTDPYAGSAYIFNRNSDISITQVTKVVASDVEVSAYFGSSVSVSGNYMIVGSQRENLALDSVGSAYAYKIDIGASTATLVEKLTASDGDSVDLYGHSVFIDGNNIAIGAFNDDTSVVDAGSVYVYDAEPLGATP